MGVGIEALLEYSRSKLGQVEIEIGCGPNKLQGRIGVDHLALPGVDVVANLEEGLGVFPDRCADVVHARSVLEHVIDVGGLMGEIHRVLKPDGKFRVFVPHFSNPYFYSDYTHRTFFGLYTFYYFVEPEEQLRRKVPVFYGSTRFRVESLRLTFAGRGRLGKPFKKLVERLVNSSPRFQEFYETNLCYLIPCYGVDAVLRPAIAKVTQGVSESE
jgi:SAM-dependent methyltransferase